MIVQKIQTAPLVLNHHQTQTLFSFNHQFSFLHEILSGQACSCQGILVAKNKYFVLCIGVLSVQECQTTANVFDNFLSIAFISSALPLT